ncbi:MAG: hypothetical protein IT572_05630 [Deltaproteobacteria bacterium]|nr:hypothetical protein [Deltaproteobacteria bacterium]
MPVLSPTLDIDFALKTGDKWEVGRVLREVGQRLGIPLEYSEDISPRSTEHDLFVKKVEDFLSFDGKEIWGKGFDCSKMVEEFRVNTIRMD